MDGNIWQKEASVTGNMAAMFSFQTAAQPSQWNSVKAKGDLNSFLPAEISPLCFLRSSDDVAALRSRAGETVRVPAGGVNDIITGYQGDAGSQTQVLAGATRSRAHLVVFGRCV